MTREDWKKSTTAGDMNISPEAEFLDRIDCNFPYHDKQICLDLIDEATLLPANAMFAVIEEIARAPSYEKGNVPVDLLMDLLKVIESKFDHPLKDLVLDTAYKMVTDQELSVEDVIEKLEIFRKYPNQYHASFVLYFSCDDKDGLMEPVYQNIIDEWENKL